MKQEVHDDFRPPWFLRNPHIQTVLGHWLPGPRFGYPVERRFVQLDDGDQLVLHDAIPPGWQPGDRIVILTHGLGGCHDSGHQRRFARAFMQRGIRSVRLDQRGCGAGLPYARQVFHGGRSDDILATVEEIHRWSPTSPLSLIGVSLGGNMILKMLGELGESTPPMLERALALSPPVDMQRCASLIDQKSNRFYNRFFVKGLQRQWIQRGLLFPDQPRPRFFRGMTIRDFDSMITAPLNGFQSVDDYYSRIGSESLLRHIRLPTLIITSRDDPFITSEPFESADLPEDVKVLLLKFGGHLGFLGPDGQGGYRWAERRVIDWALASED